MSGDDLDIGLLMRYFGYSEAAKNSKLKIKKKTKSILDPYRTASSSSSGSE